MSKEYKIKGTKGIHTGEHLDPNTHCVTVEFEGQKYFHRWELDMLIEPYLVDALLEHEGGPEDALNSGILREYCINAIANCDVDGITLGELEIQVAAFNSGWDARAKWEAEQKTKTS